MNEQESPRDGAFVVLFSGSIRYWEDMKFFLGCRISDGLYELLGGGFDISDITPDEAACREVSEETKKGIQLQSKELNYFCHMVQKLPLLGQGEKGHVFVFLKEIKEEDMIFYEDLEASEEHRELGWHKLSDLFESGETKYKTATLRFIIYLLHYLSDRKRKFRFGVLHQKVNFRGLYEF